jgi:hypothetical protein
MRALLATLLLTLAIPTAFAAEETMPASKDFKAELKAMLDKSYAEKKGLMFHVQGQAIGGAVIAVLDDAVIVRNQEYGRILIRFERIDAVAGN